jgi:hypothetical protein
MFEHDSLGLATTLPPSPPAPPTEEQRFYLQEKERLQASIKRGAKWFYLVAGLSLVNSIVVTFGSGWHFLVGLGITQVVDALAGALGPSGTAVSLFIDVLVAGAFIVFGVFSSRGIKPVFLTGMVLYGLDSLILLLGRDLLGFAFHGFALFSMFGGLAAIGKLRLLEQSFRGKIPEPINP